MSDSRKDRKCITEQNVQYDRMFQMMENRCKLLERHIELLDKQIGVQNKQMEDFFTYLKNK